MTKVFTEWLCIAVKDWSPADRTYAFDLYMMDVDAMLEKASYPNFCKDALVKNCSFV